MNEAANQALWQSLFRPAHARSARAELLRRAREDDAEAQWLLANWITYSPKHGYRPAAGRAAQWILRAANLGFVPAMVEAGQYLERRDGEQGPAASRWYKRAAEKGSAEAAWALGINAEKGFGRSADWASAYKWFRRAAEISAPYGWKPGEYALAGIVSGVQAKEGLGLLRKAAQAKSAEAEFYMGLRAMCGIGCAIDTQLSRVWFERSAANPMAVSSDDGERCAHALLGRQLAFGARTRRAGIRHLEIAAATGLPLAKIDLALALLPRTRQWAPIARLLREGVGSYKGPWRRPGGVWLGIEPLTRARVVLACELLDLQMPRAAMTFGRVTMNFKCDDSR